MRVYLSMVILACVAVNASLAHLSESELDDAISNVHKKIGLKNMDLLRDLVYGFITCDKLGRGLEHAMSDYLGSKTHAYGKKRKDFDKYFKKTIGEACSSLVEAVSAYEDDYKHLKEVNPDYFPYYNVVWFFKGLNYCRTITQNMDSYADKTYHVN